MRKNSFAESLIKGKIAESIFQQMFLENGGYTVIPFGYEQLVPDMASLGCSPSAKKVIDNIRTSPDFALISSDKKEVFLVEVKFRSRLSLEEVIETAKKQAARWSPSWLFVATLEGFYLDACEDIIKNGSILKLGSVVRQDLQEKYLKLIKEFEPSSSTKKHERTK